MLYKAFHLRLFAKSAGNKNSWRIKKYFLIVITCLLLVLYYFCLPAGLFNDPYSTVLQDQRGELLSASISADGQWRFPPMDSVPSKFMQAIAVFEDRRFRSHPGIDLLSLGRALKQNIQAGKVVSGGSTISMQVIRLSRKGQSRTIFEKLLEMVLATRLELRYSKDEIMALYASHAPFGGNVVGLEAACWRYFGRNPRELSWSEAALLAVLPNAPSLIHPGKNRTQLIAKRDRLLDKLLETGKIDSFTCMLAKEESIPDEPKPLPQYARHLLFRSMKEGYAQKRINTTLDLALQHRVEQIIEDHHVRLRGNQIYNAAAIVLDVKSGNVLSYVGNTYITDNNYHGDEVDVVMSPRSTGSILKPFLYAAMMDEGLILPSTLMPDIPTIINGFAPKNFSKEYDGAVPADRALIRSLNVPAVHMLRGYRYEKFHTLLGNIGMNTLKNSPDHYGLSLILGGAEGTLWDISGMYASLARTLHNYFEHPGKNKYDRNDFHPPAFLAKDSVSFKKEVHLEENSWLSAASIFLTFEALKELYRPGEESGWRHFSSSKKIAWKTGTSFGFRDGWAIGLTPDHVVGVWVGNADGEGRPGLTGTDAAAPVMFDIFSQLPGKTWFSKPSSELERITICARSGFRNTASCGSPDTVWVAKNGLNTSPCPYHQRIHLSKDKKFLVNSSCESLGQMVTEDWFILPPVQEYYYRPKNITYKLLPPLHKRCQMEIVNSMELIYPKAGSRIFIPRELNGESGNAIFQLAHRNPSATVYWHLDGTFIGSTSKVHHLGLAPREGKHVLTLVDEHGMTLERRFEVISKM